jgi:hypothetical protein
MSTEATAPTATTDTISATVDRWLDVYTDADAGRRRSGIEALWHPQGKLIEPPLEVAGHDGIDQLAQGLQAQYAGNTFRRCTEIDEHHGVARYGWEMVAADGSISATGQDVVHLDADGRLVEVVGFFGMPPARGA